MAISDDGPGLGANGEPNSLGHRGLADMRAEAANCGATLTTGARIDGRGTVIRFAWTAA